MTGIPLQPFQFFDLPKGIHFIVYDLLATITTTGTNDAPGLTATTRQKLGMALLSTCIQVYTEATVLHCKTVVLENPIATDLL
jgi:hypothetical protein